MCEAGSTNVHESAAVYVCEIIGGAGWHTNRHTANECKLKTSISHHIIYFYSISKQQQAANNIIYKCAVRKGVRCDTIAGHSMRKRLHGSRYNNCYVYVYMSILTCQIIHGRECALLYIHK